MEYVKISKTGVRGKFAAACSRGVKFLNSLTFVVRVEVKLERVDSPPARPVVKLERRESPARGRSRSRNRSRSRSPDRRKNNKRARNASGRNRNRANRERNNAAAKRNRHNYTQKIIHGSIPRKPPTPLAHRSVTSTTTPNYTSSSQGSTLKCDFWKQKWYFSV